MAVLRVPTVRVRLDFGDGAKPIELASGINVISATAQEGEQDRSNNCQIVFDDPGLKIATLLRAKSLKAGAIAVPKTLLEKDQTIAGAAGAVPASTKDLPKDGKPGSDLSAYIGGTVEVSLSAEYRAYLDVIAWCEGAAYNTYPAYSGVVTDFSRHPHPPIASSGSDATGRYQFLSTTWDPLGMPNFEPTNQDLGAVKLIKQQGAGAAVESGLSGVDTFLDRCSWVWASIPDRNGNFRYPGQGSKSPQMIRDALSKTLNYYKTGGVTGSKTATQVGPAPAPAVATNQDFTPKDAIEVSVEMGWSDQSETVVSTFWYTSHSLSTSQPPRTTIGGQGIRFVLSQGDRSRKIWRNISLRQVADRLGAKYGVNVAIPSTPASEKIVQILAQKGQNDYQFLSEVAAASGFLIKETGTGTAKKMEFVRAAEKGGEIIKVDRAWGATLSTSDSASNERLVKTLPPISAIEDDKAIGDGYTTRIAIAVPTIATMRIQPGMILEIPPGAISGLPSDSAFCRQYRVKANQRSYSGGKLTQILTVYIPVVIEAKKKDAGTGSGSNPTGAQSKSIAKPPNRNGKFLFLSATGQLEPGTDLNLLELALYDGGNKVDFVSAVSGQAYAQNLSLANTSGSGAPLPPNKAGYQLANGESSLTSFGPGLGRYIIEVIIPSGTRSGILIHEDANATRAGYTASEGGTSYGTIGCVGVIGEPNMVKVFNWYLGGATWLIVDFDNFITV